MSEPTEMDAVIENLTAHGPGDLDNLPEEDFEGFPVESVEND